jgi:hypothetical protein
MAIVADDGSRLTFRCAKCRAQETYRVGGAASPGVAPLVPSRKLVPS